MTPIIAFNIFILIVWFIGFIGSIFFRIMAIKTLDYDKKKDYIRNADYYMLVMWLSVFISWITYFIINK
mgnify:CR=1 FL=1